MSLCFFIGHRDTPDSLFKPLSDAVERHIVEYGVTEFVVGGYGRFDPLAAKAVSEAKKRHPEVTLTLLLPYHPQERPVPLPPGFDGTFYPPGMETVPRRGDRPRKPLHGGSLLISDRLCGTFCQQRGCACRSRADTRAKRADAPYKIRTGAGNPMHGERPDPVKKRRQHSGHPSQ